MTLKFEDLTPEQVDGFTMGGRVNVYHMYRDDSGPTPFDVYYTRDKIIEWMKDAAMNTTRYYGQTDAWLYEALRKYPITNKTVLIFGSAKPWYESIALSRHVSMCFVSEYGDRSACHSKIAYLKPEEMRDIKTYAGFSISSFEHSGLGRYGDPIDVDGDLKAMECASEHIKPGGLLFLSVPIGVDAVVWNCHRIYGVERLDLLLAKWHVVETIGLDYHKMYRRTDKCIHQPIFVLRRNL